jgi:hypothetical protein
VVLLHVMSMINLPGPQARGHLSYDDVVTSPLALLEQRRPPGQMHLCDETCSVTARKGLGGALGVGAEFLH